MEKEARKLGINFNRELKNGSLDKVAEEFSYKTVEDLLVAVGYAKLTPKQVLNRLLQPETKKTRFNKKIEAQKNSAQQEIKEINEERKEGVVIRGAKNLLIRYAKCCQPVKGDPIVGYISRGRGIIVHTSDCPNVKNLEPHRLVEVTWAGEDNKTYTATIKIVSKNEKRSPCTYC